MASGPGIRTVERTLAGSGSTVRLVLEALPGRRVRVVEYHRRRGPAGRFERVRGEEGVTYPFDQLRLDQPYEAVFPQPGLFDDLAAPVAGSRRTRRLR